MMPTASIKCGIFLLYLLFQLIFSQTTIQRGQLDMQNLVNALGESGQQPEHHLLYSYTPSTPLPENVNCYVEIPATRVGGRCVRIGRQRRRHTRRRHQLVWSCQAGVHLDIGNSDCSVLNPSRAPSRRVDG